MENRCLTLKQYSGEMATSLVTSIYARIPTPQSSCTSSNWLTLGLGLTPKTILADSKVDCKQKLWRDVTTVPSGSMFDIHFQVVDAVSKSVLVASDCYQYTVRSLLGAHRTPFMIPPEYNSQWLFRRYFIRATGNRNTVNYPAVFLPGSCTFEVNLLFPLFFAV